MTKYYDILGISKNATDIDIKKAYRVKAREHHPDVAQNKEEAEKKFKEINEAYQALSDKEKKSAYDRYGHSAFGGGAGGGGGANPFGGQGFGGFQNGGGGGFEDIDPFDIFNAFFGGRGGGFNQRQRKKGKNLYYRMKISFVESIKGVTKKIKVEDEIVLLRRL